MVLEVLDVGDGACTVVTCGWDDCRSVSIIDCGERRAPAGRPADVLDWHLGAGLADVERLVVTHFDSDHWHGLRELAPRWSGVHRGLRKPIQIVYPRLPEDVAQLPAGVLALISTAKGSSGVRSVDLLRAWNDVADLSPTPVADGDVFFMGCDDWHVVWPPKRLPEDLQGSISRGLADLNDLAERMGNAGFPMLATNLEVAYGAEGVGFPSEPAPDGSLEAKPDSSADQYFRVEGILDALTGETADHEHLDHGNIEIEPEVIPGKFLPEMRSLAKRLGRLNNLLSLAFHNPSHKYQPHTLVVGDLEGIPLRWLIEARKFDQRYDVVLAPHHGSHVVPQGFPSARVCVAQAGADHHSNWGRHRESHDDSSCVTTYGSNVTIY